MSRVRFARPVRWLALLVCMPAWAAHYSIIEIPAPLTLAVGLDDSGDVIGRTTTSTPGYFTGAFLYRHSSRVVIELPCIGPPCLAEVAGINDHATAVGLNRNATDGYQAVRWPLSGGVEYVVPDLSHSWAMGIANSGDVVGAIFTDRASVAYLWKADGSSTPLGDLLQCGQCVFAPNSFAGSINDRGHIVGYSDWAVDTTPDPDGPTLIGVHAFLWRNGEMADLGALGDGSYSSANGLNNADEVVGNTTVGSVNTAFLHAGGRMYNLGNLGHRADLNSSANGINDRREIVGWSEVRRAANGSIVQRAFLYSFGHMRDLNTLIDRRGALSGRVKLTNASAINCNGWIAASGYDVRSGKPHAYLLRRLGGERRECRRPRE